MSDPDGWLLADLLPAGDSLGDPTGRASADRGCDLADHPIGSPPDASGAAARGDGAPDTHTVPPGGPEVELRARPAAGPLGEAEAEALSERERQADALRAAEIRATMETERRLSKERIRALWSDLQTELFRLWEEVLLRRQKIMDELFEKWSKMLTE